MRKTCRWAGLVLAAVLLVTVNAFGQVPQKTQKFVLTLKTQTMPLPFKMPKIPNMPNIPGLADLNKPTREITGEATYANKAVEPIFVTVPADLKLPANKLVLHVWTPGEVNEETPAAEPATPPQKPKGKIITRLFWRPEEAQGPIEHEVDFAKLGDGAAPPPDVQLPPRMMAGLFSDLEKVATGSESVMPPTVVGKGNYVLNTGGTAPLAGFLPPLRVSQPEALSDVDPAEGIDLEWAPVAGARGFVLYAMEMENKGEGVSQVTEWVSTRDEPPVRVRGGDYEQATTIADDLRDGILLPAGTTSCKIPAGMFSGNGMFTLTVTAVGEDFYSNIDGLVVRGKIRAQWMGMKMAGMGGMLGMPGGPGRPGMPGKPNFQPEPDEE